MVARSSESNRRKIPLPVRVLGENVIIRDFYPVNPPYAHVAIYVDPEGITRYHVIEPPLTGREIQVIDEIKEIILDEARLDPSLLRSYDRAKAALEAEVDRVIKAYGIRVPRRAISKIKYYIVRDFIGYGPLDPIYRDPYVEDITCIPEFEYVLAFVNGKPVFGTIGKIFNTILGHSKCVKEDYDIVKAYPQIPVEVLSLDIGKGRIVKGRVVFIARRPSFEGKILSIKLEDGRVFYVTPYHPVFTISLDGIKVKRAREVKVGDLVLAVRKLNIHSTSNHGSKLEVNLIELFSKTPYKDRIKVQYISENGVKESILLKEFLELEKSKHLIVKYRGKLYLTTIEDGVEYRVPAVIRVNRDLGKAIGYYLSRGYIPYNLSEIHIKFDRYERKLARECKSVFERAFNTSVKVRVDNKHTTIIVDNKIIVWLFKDVWCIGVSDHDKAIPNFIFEAPEWFIREMIKSILGNSKYNATCTITVKSLNLAYSLIYLLLKLGIPFKLNIFSVDNRLRRIQIRIDKRLYNSLIIEPKRLQMETSTTLGRYSHLKLEVPSVGNGGLYYKVVVDGVGLLSLGNTRLLGGYGKSSDVVALKVIEVNEIPYYGYVYDFKVESYHNFVHGVGVITHNCDGYGLPVYVYHRDYEWMPTNVTFPTPEALDRFIRRLAYKAGQSITFARPIVEGPLPPEGFRVHLTLGEVSRRGSTFTIRKYSVEPYTIVDLLGFNTLSPTIAAYYWLLVDNVQSMMIAGPMASGKTTLLNAIAMLIRPEAKIVTIEDTPEIRLPHENWVPLITRPSFEPGVQDVTLFDLLKSALRQRPEFIIVGEIRGEEAYTFFQALAVGHGGLCTIHGETVEAVISRLESKPMNIPRVLIPLMKVITLTGRVKGPTGIVRRVIRVTEIIGIDPRTNEILLNDVFKWDPNKDSWTYSGRSYLLETISENKNIPLADVIEDLRKRSVILKWMLKKELRRFSDVAKVVRSYYQDPERVYAEASSEVEEVQLVWA